MRLLVIEDDSVISGNIADFLGGKGFAVDRSGTAEEGLFKLETEDYDCLVLDWMLPDGSGPVICRRLRSQGKAVPILILTAKSQLEDKITGLESGADDYLTKPFALSELLARVRALIRRKSAKAPAPQVVIGDMTIDTNTREVRKGGQVVALSPKEYGILEYLAANPNMATDRTDILYHVWGEDADPFSNTVDVHIRYLRQKLKDKKNGLIKTVKGKGYLLWQD